jgi:hypothetical protein
VPSLWRVARLKSLDRDRRRFGLGLLLDGHFEHAVSVAGRDPVAACVVR